MKGFSLQDIFQSQDSKFALKTAILVTMVPITMLGLIMFSLWLLTSLNHSYFIAHGLTVTGPSKETFILYLLRSQLDYLPYIALFLIAVFFLGLYLAQVALRPFNQLSMLCENVLRHDSRKLTFSGLNNKKLLVKTGYFLDDYAKSFRNKTRLVIPKEIMEVNGPMLDWVFYFQFSVVISILTFITVFSISFFTEQLHGEITSTALSLLKAHKGMNTFISSQSSVLQSIVLVPSALSVVIYGLIARLTISKIEGVTFAYVRDIRDMAAGKPGLRLRHRSDDPGQVALESVNRLLDQLHPEYATPFEAEVQVAAILSKA